VIVKKYPPDWGSINWDIAEPGIRCKVDSLGANVYEFKQRGSFRDPYRVLSFNRETAKETLDLYFELKQEPDTE
jgi:hypothetical protein